MKLWHSMLLLCLISTASASTLLWYADPEGMWNRAVIESVVLHDGKLTVTARSSTRAWQDTFCASNGVVVLEKQVPLP